MARPLELTDLVAQRIVAAVKAGASRSGAAKSARVGRSTLLGWLARGREGEQPFAELLDRVREAEGDLEKRLVVAAFDLVEGAENETVRAKMIEMLLTLRCGWGKVGESAKSAAQASEQRDPVADLAIVESVAAALRSRAA